MPRGVVSEPKVATSQRTTDCRYNPARESQCIMVSLSDRGYTTEIGGVGVGEVDKSVVREGENY